MGLKVALLGENCAENRHHLDGRLDPAWDVALWTPAEPDDKALDTVRNADALVIGGDALVKGVFGKVLPAAERLRMMQLPFAGFDFLTPDRLPEGLLVCNAQGHEQAMAEYVVAALLEWEIGFRLLDPEFRGGSWARTGMSRDDAAFHGEVYGKTLGLFGYGLIGEETAKRAAAFGMRTVAVARSPRDETPPPLDWIGTRDDMDRLLAESDYLALVCDLNDETLHAIDAAALAKMKPTSMIVNVARGPVAEEEALYTALKKKRIAGAVLDTWYTYPNRPQPGQQPEASPRPSRFPFHELANVVMTPHCSAHTRGADKRRWESIAENLNALGRGERPASVVMVGTRRQSA